jgi:hypothetical protein
MTKRSLLGLMVPVVLATTIGWGCSHLQARRMEGRYAIGAPGDGWQRMKAGEADRAWYAQKLSATIYSDSNCASRYEDGHLPDLLAHLTFGVANGEPLHDEEMVLDGRIALVRSWKGNLDGLQVQVGAMVTKKHHCIYDVLYVAPPSTFDAGWDAFLTVVQGFGTRGG